MEITEKIIDYIKRNQVSTTEVADCLGKTGALPNVLPINHDPDVKAKERGIFHR